jgi:alpha-D-ribose 1-methylphosphonate 5-triphosphate synthase subunit PhnH
MATPATLERLGARESQAVFRVLLDTLARPGLVLPLPVPGLGPAVVPLALAVVGSPVAVLGDPAPQQRICQLTGASAAAAADAALVAIYPPADPAAICRLPRGSALAPERGAKVGLACRRLAEDGPGELTLELSGPGVPGTVRLGVDGIDRAVLAALSEANALFPAGIDVWLVDDGDQVAGLPRSVRQAVI